MLKHTLFGLSIISLLFGLSACSGLTSHNSAGLPSMPNEAFGTKPVTPSPAQIHALPEHFVKDIQTFSARPEVRRLPAFEQLFAYLEIVSQQLQYDTQTHSSTELLTNGYGNCLSLAVLTSSFAQELGVEISYELLNDNPVYETNGSVVNKALHVRTVLYGPKMTRAYSPYQHVTTSRPTLIVDFFPEEAGDNAVAKAINEKQFLARYYLNVAAEKLALNDINNAYWFAQEALLYDKHSIDALNMLAVLYKRSGDYQTATALYEHALSKDPKNITLLKNYRLLAQSAGDQTKQRQLERRLRLVDDPSPLDWIYSANDHLAEGQYKVAAKHFKKAIKKAPYLHEAYVGLAKSYTLMGNYAKAEQAMEDALELVENKETRQRYQNKWLALQSK